MLKGHVFSKQIFGNPMFALFINTFLNGRNGVSNNYKNGMKITYSGSNLTIDSGAVCVQGRFLEEDTGSTVAAGNDTAYCKLVIEINLDLQNTESQFNQGVYKVVKSATSYPNLTQTNIVKNNAGIYQYELARFRTNSGGITEFQDMRTFLDFDSIYDAIESECSSVLENIQQELVNVKDGSAYFLKATQLTNQDLNTLTMEGYYYASGGNTCSNKPEGINDFGLFVKRTAGGKYKQTIDYNDVTYTRYYSSSVWTSWVKTITNGDFAVIKGVINTTAATSSTTVFNSMQIDFPTGFNSDNCVVISWGIHHKTEEEGVYGKAFGYTNPSDSRTWLRGAVASMVTLDHQGNKKITFTLETPFTQAYTYEFEIVLMKITKPEVTLLGDANYDGIVNSADATLIQNYVQGKASLNLQGFVNADVTKDGDVKSSDYLKVKDYVDGKISSLN